MATAQNNPLPIDLLPLLQQWGAELGLQQIGVSAVEVDRAEQQLNAWLADGRHGEMEYMARHGTRRSRPAELVPGTIRVISARMDYLPDDEDPWSVIADGNRAYVARYARGRDYHKLLRKRLQRLADRLTELAGPHGYRVFVDSGPVLEKPIAANAGLGWIGKHTNLIHPRAGSWFFLGEIYTDLPLPTTQGAPTSHCGSCTRCIHICPTRAITAPYELDARRCISYLTIELRGAIPEEFRPAIGNRIFGCDDCQLVCPWNRFARITRESDFSPRHRLNTATLVELWGWDEQRFLHNTEGSVIRRLGYDLWLRNLAIGLGNAPASAMIVHKLAERRSHSSDLVKEHIDWAITRQTTRTILGD